MSANKRLLSPLKSSNDLANSKKQKLFEEFKVSESIEVGEFDDFFDDSFEFDIPMPKPLDLDLSSFKRCTIEQLDRDRKTFDLVLHVRSETSGDKENNQDDVPRAKCHLQGPWANTKLAVDEVVSLLGVWDTQLNAYKIDKDQGFCISSADVLLSGTSVVGSLFCMRKAVLQDRFRGVDAGSKVMVVGSLVHELLQLTLRKRLSSYKEIQNAARDLLESQDTAYMLYGNQLTREETTLEVENFVPNITAFVKQYVKGDTAGMTLQAENFQGTLVDIADIEENLWVPQLGLKGKIDVSVHINRSRDNKCSLATTKHAIPLELKTGRATFSMEHKGQLILYQMMLKAIGRDMSSSGLLLYLREGILREIRSGHNEQRDLIALRNELAYYLTRLAVAQTEDNLANNLDGKLLQPFELPEPISHHSACSNCAYAKICCAFAQTDPNLQLSTSHPLKKVMKDATSHLQLGDYKYFIHWCTLLALEEQEDRKNNFQRSLWTETPETRQLQGRAIVGLQLDGNTHHEETRYIHTFKPRNLEIDNDLTLSGFSVGEYVIISSGKRLAIASGFIQAISSSNLAISLERDLRQNYADETFIVDKHESQTTHVFNYTNLGLLLDETEQAESLRNILINLKLPTYAKTLPKIVATKGKEMLQALNSLQRSAVLKALTTESFMLIKGLPGTGKTQTLVAIVRLLYLLGKSVIITSHTHSAVDNLFLRLKPYNLPILRLGSSARAHPELEFCTESFLMKECKTEKELAQKYDGYSIIGVTCLGSSHSIFLHRRFDYCIVDEATQVMQPTILRPLYFSSKFILVGDPDQLPPLIRSREARKRGADESLFQRLDRPEATFTLSLQYRMNKTITKLANELTYAGALKCGSSEIEMSNLRLNLSDMEKSNAKWLQRTLQTHIDQSVFLIDTSDCADRSAEFVNASHSEICFTIEDKYSDELSPASPREKKNCKKRMSKYVNYCEAAIIFYIVKSLLIAGYDPSRIGVIAPYRAQVELLKKLKAQYHDYYREKQPTLNFALAEINTVDQYQGRDKDIIVYSGTKTGSSTSTPDMSRAREVEILEDKRRLTVAITRAKHKLILVADSKCLEQYKPFEALLARIPRFCKLLLQEGKLDFQWKVLLNEMSEVMGSRS